jgi:hypothetical protein
MLNLNGEIVRSVLQLIGIIKTGLIRLFRVQKKMKLRVDLNHGTEQEDADDDGHQHKKIVVRADSNSVFKFVPEKHMTSYC